MPARHGTTTTHWLSWPACKTCGWVCGWVCSRDLLIASGFMVALVVGSLDQVAVLEADRVVELIPRAAERR